MTKMPSHMVMQKKVSKCFRICGAYFYRLSRRHSTILLISSFIITITIILQLYSYRHQTHTGAHFRVGNFDYKPGRFLEGHQPNESISYCRFNYGLPEALQWETLRVYPSPENKSKTSYGVIYNAIEKTAYDSEGKLDAVTYATQTTPEYLYHVVEVARYWDGPISMAVYVPGYDLDIAMQMLIQLCHCYENMSKVSVHLFFPSKHFPVIRTKEQIMAATTPPPPPPPTVNETASRLIELKKIEAYKNLNPLTRGSYINFVRKNKLAKMMQRMPFENRNEAPNLRFEDCSGLDSYDIPLYRKQNHMLYPINVGRNVARNASTTNYFIVSDIEMVPSEGLAPKFLAMVRKLMGDKKRDEGHVFAKTVFVVPLFEVDRGVEIPRDKNTLLQLVKDNQSRYFHQRVCPHCQRFPGLQSWLSKPDPGAVEPFLIAKREYPYHRWEPLYFGTKQEPWYNELLSWEGRQDKMTQMLELCLKEYRMVVLDGGFLCHAAALKQPQRHKRAEKINARRYLKIIGTLKQTYPDRTQCKANWGQSMMAWWGV